MINLKIIEGGHNFIYRDENMQIRHEAFRIAEKIRNMLENSDYESILNYGIINIEYTSNIHKDLLNVKITISYENANVTIDTFRRMIQVSWCNYSSIYCQWDCGFFSATNLVRYLNNYKNFRYFIKLDNPSDEVLQCLKRA